MLDIRKHAAVRIEPEKYDKILDYCRKNRITFQDFAYDAIMSAYADGLSINSPDRTNR